MNNSTAAGGGTESEDEEMYSSDGESGPPSDHSIERLRPFRDPLWYDRYCDRYLDDPPGYDLAVYDMYREDELVRNHERIQQEEDDKQEEEERCIRAEREKQEWPEDMPRQYDESFQEAQRRNIIMMCIRRFLNIS